MCLRDHQNDVKPPYYLRNHIFAINKTNISVKLYFGQVE